MEDGSCNPAGASVTRGGGANGPAAVYAIRKWDEWLRKYAPPGAATTTSTSRCRRSRRATSPSRSSGTRPSPRRWSRRRAEGNNTVDDDGKPLWRMAPSPHGPYWEEGQKLGYQDAGSWTLFKSTPVDRRKAAWLYAQFVVSKTVDREEDATWSHLHPRLHDSMSSFTERAPKLGGLVEFYRSPDRVMWSPDRRQRSRLSEAGADLVAADRRRELRGLHPAGSDGPPRR